MGTAIQEHQRAKKKSQKECKKKSEEECGGENQRMKKKKDL